MSPLRGVFAFVCALALVALGPGLTRAVAGDHQRPYGPFPYGLKNHSLSELWAEGQATERHYLRRVNRAGPVAPLESAPCGPLTPPHWHQVAPSEWVKPEQPYRELSWYDQTPVCPPLNSNAAWLGSGACGGNPWYTRPAWAAGADVQAAHGPYLAPYVHTDR
jgi:hypothetical protein